MLRIVPHGALKKALPRGFKTSITLDCGHIPTAITALEQLIDVHAVLNQTRWSIYLGDTLSKATELSESQIRWGQFNESLHTIHIVPNIAGKDPATLTSIAVQVATTIIVTGVTMLLQPKPQSGTDTKKGGLYGGGLNTSTIGAPIAYLAGMKVPVNFQILEADVRSTTNSGGGSAYDGTGNTTPVVPPGGGTGGGSGTGGWFPGDPDVNPRYDWVDTGRGIYNQLDHYDGLSGAGPGKGRSLPNGNTSYAQLSALLAPGGGRTDGPYGSTIAEKEQHIFFDRVALRDPGTNQYNLPGVRWTYRVGEVGQPVVGIVPGLPSPWDANDPIEPDQPLGVTKAVQMTLADVVIAQVRLRLLFRGRDGKEHPEPMEIRVDTKRANAATWNVGAARGYWNEKNSDGFDAPIHIPAPPKTEDPDEGWMFRLVRLTGPAVSSDGRTSIRESTLVGWSEVRNIDLTYDGSDGGVPTTLLGVGMTAVDGDRASFPEVSAVWSGRRVRVPTNYNTRTREYSGFWDMSWKYEDTDNPVWLWLDMMTATDGMGGALPDRMFNPMKLLPLAKYCDELVNGKPRWTVNKQYADERSFWEHISEFCKTFRAITYYDGAQYYLVMERPGMPVLHYVNNDMVENGEFLWDMTDAERRYNEVEVEYDDPLKHYDKSSIVVRDQVDIDRNASNGAANGGVVRTRVYKEGCTSADEAKRWGEEFIWSCINEPNIITFKCGLNGAQYRPGERMELEDWVNTGASPIGRVDSIIDADTIKLPTEVTFQAMVPYKFYAQRGALRIVRDITFSTTTTTDTLTLEDHGLEANHPCGISRADEQVLFPCIIRTIEDEGEGIYSVTVQEWREEKFAHYAGLPLPEVPDFPAFDRNVGKVTDLTAKYHAEMDPLRGSVQRIKLNWTPPTTQVSSFYIKHMSPTATTWKLVDNTTYSYHELEVAEAGSHRFTVQAVNMFGAISQPVLVVIDTNEASHMFVAPVYHTAY